MAQAVQAVEQVRAVRDVVNRLKVDNLSNRKGDEAIWRHILQSIWWDPRLYQENIHVQVEDGEVTLSGSVFSLQDFHMLSRLAWNAGAERVRNHVKIKYAPAFLSAKNESFSEENT
jgi:osmotically-inducible protein OsmY